jgi:SET domain-containing protein
MLFVDASRKAGHGSSLSHSCAPTCEVRLAAFKGELCLAMTTLRELEMGEDLTFDYSAVTESLDEFWIA